jgi:hypothetical protein
MPDLPGKASLMRGRCGEGREGRWVMESGWRKSARYWQVSRGILTAWLPLIFAFAAAIAGEPSRAGSDVKTDFDQACFGALRHLPPRYGELGGEPFSEMAIALIKRCNANPDRMICDVASTTMMREYGKTPFSCGIDTVYTAPVILLPDTR